jgi:hypothetical protein
MAARALLAAMLLLSLVAGSIVFPAAASGPLCTLACCAGRAPHAAGSCMDGSCDAKAVRPHPPNSNSPQSHHHHPQQPAPATDSNAPTPAFAGAMASAVGFDMGQVPTIEAGSEEGSANRDALEDTGTAVPNKSTQSSVSTKVFSKPCQPDCGACASSFAAPKRSRNATGVAGVHNITAHSSVQLIVGQKPPVRKRSAFGRQSVPRGPPFSFSC